MFSAVRPPYLLRRYYNRFIWNLNPESKSVYLTFDDGPIPGPTDFVLDQLQKFNAKATFFCIGDNVRKNPELFQKVNDAGHRIGNHTFNHLNGWQHNTDDYVKNVQSAESFISTDIFRPPYGRIKKQQADVLLDKYKIIMWDVLSYDYDKEVSPEQCYLNVVNNVRPGSIIVFHDSLKAFRNLEYTLPRCLRYLKDNDYSFEVI